jgi:FtsZ-interacting cell division protein ZipA
MKKSLLMLGLAFLTAQPAFSQVQPSRQAVQQPMYQQRAYQQPMQQRQQAMQQQRAYQQPMQQQAQPVYQRAYQPVYMPSQPVYQTAVNPCWPQQGAFYYYNPQCMTGAAAPVCPQQPRSGWKIFKEDYLGFD